MKTTRCRQVRNRVLAVALAVASAAAVAGAEVPASAPGGTGGVLRVLLIGDSISLGYQPFVAARLKGKADVQHGPAPAPGRGSENPNGNARDSRYTVANIKQWVVADHAWDVIHFNCGIWDTALVDAKTGQTIPAGKQPSGLVKRKVEPEEYRRNLEQIVKTLEGTGARLVWASTTPVLVEKGNRLEDIPKYNEIAAEVMKKHHIPVNDLYGLVKPSAEALLGSDKVHFQLPGYDKLGEQVAQAILAARAAQKPPAAEGAGSGGQTQPSKDAVAR
jgi:acyl-CoA thioesterase-1